MGLFDFSFNFKPEFTWKGSARATFPKYLKELVCELQGNYAQYTVVAHNHHKALREEWSTAPSPELAAINTSRARLYLYLINQARQACLTIDKFAREHHFGGRSKFEPRFCVKVPCEPDCTTLDDLYRSSSAKMHRVTASDNTAFNFIRDVGRSFISNDILAQIFSAKGYRNPRLDSDAVKSNYQKLAAGRKRFHSYYRKDLPDHQWQGQWKDPTGTPAADHLSCYKSTLVVPMTLINANLSDDFKEFMFEDDAATRYAKLTFGFLCWDHINTDFFQDHDEHFAYIAADILSLFMVTAFGLTSRSATCAEINKEIGILPAPTDIPTTLLNGGR